jgi:hypothetical protein
VQELLVKGMPAVILLLDIHIRQVVVVALVQ